MFCPLLYLCIVELSEFFLGIKLLLIWRPGACQVGVELRGSCSSGACAPVLYKDL